MIIHDKQDTTTEIGRNYWLFIIQIWKFGQFEGGWGVRSWSSGIVDPHSLAELFIFFFARTIHSQEIIRKKSNPCGKSSKICLQTRSFCVIILPKLSKTSSLCCVVPYTAGSPGLKDHTVMRPSPAPLTQKRPLLSKPKDSVKLHRIQLRETSPFLIKRGTLGPQPPWFL